MRAPAMAVVLGLCALPAFGDPDPNRVDLKYTLTQIDGAPLYDEIRGSNLENTDIPFQAILDAIKDPPDHAVDPGVRLRAIRALPVFCPAQGACAGSPAHQELDELVTTAIAATHANGIPLLTLRTAVEALGAAASGDPADVDLLIPLLTDPARDVRTTTARALAALCPSDLDARSEATMRLRIRIQQEPIEQVRLALTKALRDLQACVASPRIR